MPGEVLGIIGKNGAGKSTLLKILSKVTGPTTGKVHYDGRIGSLLEVGTGFHSEMTGRENIFLNGAILGMTKAEIRKKLDEIIDFSGCERYIDTPVKRYSSGMMVRLGFAVAAHLEPEILVIDEVLAVGDAEFQKKAIGKMQDVSKNEGRTVLFVSHNMAAVKSLCTKGIVLENGKIRFESNSIEKVIGMYLSESSKLTYLPISERKDRTGNQIVTINELQIDGLNKDNYLQNDLPLRIKIKYRSDHEIKAPKIYLSINDENEQTILFLDSTVTDAPLRIDKEGEIIISISDSFGLSAGKYFMNIAFFSNDTMTDYIKYALIFNVIDGVFYPNGKFPSSKSICHIQQNWNFNNDRI